jgi:5-formyltetrahydrofolate cyclo-ligase
VEADISKATVRAQVAQSRRALSVAVRREKSAAISQRLSQLPAYQSSQLIGLYAATEDEVDTALIMANAREQSKQVCYPRVTSAEGHDMTFCAVDTSDDLQPGYRGILEPSSTDPIAQQQIDCLCVPGLAFDSHGHRLGRGAGFYDRWLATYTGTRVALAFECQLVDTIPTQAHDQAVDCIITETRTITCHGGTLS